MDVPLIARVECRSDGRPEERPVAVWVGGVRVAVRDTLDDAVVGGRTAGEPSVRRVQVLLEDGERLRLVRVLPAGEWRVLRLED